MIANEVIRLIDAGFTAEEIRAMQTPAPTPAPAPAQNGVESKLTELIDLIKAGNLRAGAPIPSQGDPFTRVINPYTGKEVG